MNKRIVELDGLRGIAILMVVLWHYLAISMPALPGTSLARANQLLALTWSGVDLFFVLSGFLITSILLTASKENHYFTTFYIRRACRILPLYVLTVLFFTIITQFNLYQNDFLFSERLPLIGYYTFTQNFFMAWFDFWGSPWLAMSWSLAIEEQFYIIIPFLVYFFDKKKLALIFIAAIIAAPFFRFYIPGLGAIVLPFCRSDSILMGGLLAILLNTPKFKNNVGDYHQWIMALLGLLFAGLCIMLFKLNRPGHYFNHFVLAIFYTTLTLMMLSEKQNILKKCFGNKMLVWCGTRSYAIYIFHEVCFGIAHYLYPNLTQLRHFFIFTLAAFLATLCLAEISFHLIEKRFIAFGHRFKYAKQS